MSGRLILSVVTGAATLGMGVVVSGVVGFAAAAALYVWIPRKPLSEVEAQAAGSRWR